LKLILLTLVRKSELTFATWDEVDFVNAIWTIPASRMKCGRPHNIYLSRQALDIMIALEDLRGQFALLCCRRATSPTSRCRGRPSTA
jgi:integrase